MNSREFLQPLIRTMTIADYDEVVELLAQTEGVTFRDADSKNSIERYLRRNPGLSFLALDGKKLIGCIMAGHDGRRGYLQHLAVLSDYRKQGNATRLIESCLDALEKIGIVKSHIDVLKINEEGQRFWSHNEWTLRSDILRFSILRSKNPNA